MSATAPKQDEQAAAGGFPVTLAAAVGAAMLAVAGVGIFIAGASGAATALVFAGALGALLTFAIASWAGSSPAGPSGRGTDLTPLGEALARVEGGDDRTPLDPAAPGLGDVAGAFNRMIATLAAQRQRLQSLAATDPVTELASHRHFHEELAAVVHRAGEAGESVAVVVVDLDGFRRLNDRLGSERGDETLQLVATTLRRVVRQGDLVARLGADDFALLLHRADSAIAREIAQRARTAIGANSDHELALTASTGFACFPAQAEDARGLLRAALGAVDLAKEAGGDTTRKYDAAKVSGGPSLSDQRAEILELLERPAPIRSVFQPLADLATGRVIGYEALARFDGWKDRGPDAWFLQAQRCGLGPELEATALRAALSQPDRPAGTYLALNVSPSALASSTLREALPEDLSDIVIEITEHELASDEVGLEHWLDVLRGRGARIAVDDAGAGYAGLTQLMRVQPDLIKLDRALVAGVHADAAKSALIEFFVLFAARVGAKVCAEGIEERAELATLADLGVNCGQGYLLARPGEPWAAVDADVTRALATGSLRTHSGTGPTAAPGPINRRYERYAGTRSGGRAPART